MAGSSGADQGEPLEAADLLKRVALGWRTLADVDDEPEALLSPGVTVAHRDNTPLCPPGWVGVVRLGPSALVVAPTAGLQERLLTELARRPAVAATDADTYRGGFEVAEVLGPATLAYVDSSRLRRPDTSGVTTLTQRPDALSRLLEEAGPQDAGESAVGDLDPPLFTGWAGDRLVAVSGYETWRGVFAHICVLASPSYRRQGWGRRVAAAATVSALAAGLLPPWRARPEASRALARSLGYCEVGEQLSLRVQ